jgi:hypothetical protein
MKGVLCFDCDNVAKELHHVVPRILGGRRAVPLCNSCHGKLHGVGDRSFHSSLTKAGQERARLEGRHPGRRPIYSDKLKRRAIELRRRGLSCRAISKDLGMSPSLVSEVTRKVLE